MLRSYELRQKEVINIKTASRLGYVDDVDIDFDSGKICGIVVPKHRFFLFHREDYVIPWENIVQVGDELILVDFAEQSAV